MKNTPTIDKISPTHAELIASRVIDDSEIKEMRVEYDDDKVFTGDVAQIIMALVNSGELEKRRPQPVKQRPLPTPWGWWPNTCGGVITSDSGAHVCTPARYDNKELTEANAIRIVACVNVHDDLVEALETLAQNYSDYGVSSCTDKSCDSAMKLLAKAKGGE